MTTSKLGVMNIGKNFSGSTKVFSDTFIPGTWPRPRIPIREKSSCTLINSNSSYHHVPGCLPDTHVQYTSPNTNYPRSVPWLAQVHVVSPNTTCIFSDLEKFQTTFAFAKGSQITIPEQPTFSVNKRLEYPRNTDNYPRKVNTNTANSACTSKKTRG